MNINVPDGFKINMRNVAKESLDVVAQFYRNPCVKAGTHRVKNKWYKEAYWWVVERFSNPNIFKTRRFKRACIHAAKETGRIKREYELSACTKEAKKHMEHIHKTKGRLKK